MAEQPISFISVTGDLHDLGDFLNKLRMNVFSSQSKAARYFDLTHSTVSRYENGRMKPALGYLAELARLVVERSALREEVCSREELLA